MLEKGNTAQIGPEVEKSMPLLSVQIPTADEELARIANYFRNPKYKKFYSKHPVRLPEDEYIQKFLKQENTLEFGIGSEYEEFAQRFRESHYQDEPYLNAKAQFESAEFQAAMADSFKVFQLWQQNWGFEIPDEYIIKPSLWVNSGVNSADNIVIVRTNPDGSLEPGPCNDPSEVPTHEMVHKGLRPLLAPYKEKGILWNWENESIARSLQANMDKPVWREHTLKLRKEYPTPIDPFLKDVVIVNDLPNAIQDFFTSTGRIA